MARITRNRPQIHHRGWLVEQSIDGFEATHPSYEPNNGDDRFVTGETLEDLAQAIEDWIHHNEAASERAGDVERARIELRTGFREEDFA